MIASLDISVEVEGAEPVRMNRMVKWLNRQATWEEQIQLLVGQLVHHVKPKWEPGDGAHFERGGEYKLDDGRKVIEYRLAFTHSFMNSGLATLAVETIAEEVQLMASQDALKQLHARALVTVFSITGGTSTP